MNLLEKLQTTYDESCFPVHDALSMEPEYECEYCGHKDVAPAHGDDCSAVDAVMAKHEIERLSAENKALETKRRNLREWVVDMYTNQDYRLGEAQVFADMAMDSVSTQQGQDAVVGKRGTKAE